MSRSDPPARPDEGRERLLDDLRIVVVQGPYFQAHAAGRAIEALRADAQRIAALEEAIDCACNALTDSINASGNDARTNLHWVAKLRRALSTPLPGASKDTR